MEKSLPLLAKNLRKINCMSTRNIVLSSDKLLLREFSESDWETVFNYQNNPAYLRYYPWEKRDARDVKKLIKSFIRWSEEKQRSKFQLAIINKSQNNLIGNCGIRKTSIESLEAELGCELNPDYWSNGFAIEAMRMIINYGFHELKLHRVWTQCVSENQPATRLVQKLKMRQEGLFREQQWIKHGWKDTVIYAILAQEWQLE